MAPSRSLGRIAGIVGLATCFSKVAGLIRSTCIAAVFGVGSVADAYNYAYLIPSFFLVLIGGINGPLHTALVSVLAKSDGGKPQQLGPSITAIVTAVLLPITVGVVAFADPLLTVVAPGLSAEVRAIAVPQLQIMAPIVLLAGWIGIGLGLLTAADAYWIPSVSPALSSLAVVGSLAIYVWRFPGSSLSQQQLWQIGGITLAVGTLVGAVAQWLLQQIAHWRSQGPPKIQPWHWQPTGIRDIFHILLPATLSSGLMSINVYIDLFFASFIPHAAAALSYAELLAQAPRGILSSMLLVPLLPAFSRLAAPEQRSQLKGQIRQGLVLTALVALPLSALLIALAGPIVRLVYERRAFDASAAEWVASLLIVYSLGLFPSLVRDVLVRVFYGLGDGRTPFRISLLNIGLNILLDYWFVHWFSASGLVLSSLGLNLMAIALLLIVLHRRLEGLPWRQWSWPILQLLGLSLLVGLVSWATWQGSSHFWPPDNWLLQIGHLGLAAGLGAGVFVLLAQQTRLPEVQLLNHRWPRN
jgi:putative peptidoglycan lipid II flippase